MKQIASPIFQSFLVLLPHKDAGRNIGVEAITSNLEDANYELVFEVDRAIRQLKTRQSWTSIKKEIVQIYGKKR